MRSEHNIITRNQTDGCGTLSEVELMYYYIESAKAHTTGKGKAHQWEAGGPGDVQ
jgi:hypothetical protein